MKKIATLGIASLLCASTTVCNLYAQPKAKAKAPAEKKYNGSDKTLDLAIERYLQKNPEAVYNALVQYQKNMQIKQQADMISHLKTDFQSAFYSAQDGQIGNTEAPVTILVFSDRQCGYCRKAWIALDTFVQKNPQVRVAFKEMPILGPNSLSAARLAVYTQKIGKFHKIDKALIAEPSPLDQSKIKNIALSNGLSSKQFQESQSSPAVTEVLERNQQLAQQINLQGTPMVFVATKDGKNVDLIQDFLSQEGLQAAVRDIQQK